MAIRIGRAEIKLLCACARRSAQHAPIVAPDHDAASIDWNALIHTAARHGVAELLFAPLSTSPITVPPDVLSHLERRVIEATGENLKRTTELAAILRLLTDHGIRALAFKGPVLAVGVYGHIGRRLSSDLDIFIQRPDAPQVRSLLLALGYRLPPRAPRRGGSLLHGLFPEAGRDDVLLPGHPWRSTIDVHVAFASWRFGIQLDHEAMWHRAATLDVADHPTLTFHPDDLLLVLAIHGMMHCWSPLRLVSDIDAVAELVTDWDAVITRAEAAGMRRVLWVALLLSARMLGTVLPAHVGARAAADQGALDIVERAVSRMFDEDAGPDRHRRAWLRSFLDSPYRRWRFVVRDTIHEWFLIWPWNTRPSP